MPKGPCLYLLMGFNNKLGLLVKVEDATSISTILLVDVDVGSFFPIYINQPLGLNTPKLPYEEPLVWEIPRVVNYIFLLFLSPSSSPLPLPSCSSYAAEFFITCRPACRRDVFLVCRRDSSSCFRKQVHRRGHQLPIHGQEGGGILLREAPSSCPNQSRQHAVLRWLMD